MSCLGLLNLCLLSSSSATLHNWKGCTTTAVCGMNAAVVYVPRMLLFKQKNMNNLLMKHCPTGGVGVPSPSGWMDSSVFVIYLKHFVACVKPSRSNLVLVIPNGHQCHTSIEAVKLARENYITLMTISPHTSHCLQPLHLTFFSPLKKAYNQEVDKWMTHYPGRHINDYDLCELLTPAYQRAACSVAMPIDQLQTHYRRQLEPLSQSLIVYYRCLATSKN